MASFSEPPAASTSDLLATLLKVRRQDLINRWSTAVTRDSTAEAISRAELLDHMPRFIDELIGALHPHALSLTSLGENAIEHGSQRLRLGFNVAEVVREYGTLHRCIIEIAGEGGLTIGLDDQAVIARWLNQGLASAVSQYVADRDMEQQREASVHLGFIAHEIRGPLVSAQVAFFGLLDNNGELAAGGQAVDRLERALRRARGVIDSVLTHASLSLSLTPRLETLSLQKALEEVAFDCGGEAQAKGIDVIVTVPDDLMIDADARLLRSAVANLLQNALKFSPPGSTTNVRVKQVEGRVYVEIEDACGGLPPGRADDVFKPAVERGEGEASLGFGLPIAQQAARAHNGTLKVRDLPGKGCIFTLDLPARVPATDAG